VGGVPVGGGDGFDPGPGDSLREGNSELIAANRLIEVLSALVEAAARGLSDANLTVLNGTQVVNEIVAGLVGQGLSILDTLKKSTAIAGSTSTAVTGSTATTGTGTGNGHRQRAPAPGTGTARHAAPVPVTVGQDGRLVTDAT
jgi:hypothetical protein